MPSPRLLITAVVLKGRSQAEVARSYGVSPAWVCELIARYRAEGESAFEPRSRQPVTSPRALSPATVELIVALRKDLSDAGHDAGAHTLAWHLQRHHGLTVSASTTWRQLSRAGLITPQPKKRPRASYLRFQAAQSNELWQTDFTHWRLADAADVENLTFLDDHSRRRRTGVPIRLTLPVARARPRADAGVAVRVGGARLRRRAPPWRRLRRRSTRRSSTG
jgi:transposase